MSDAKDGADETARLFFALTEAFAAEEGLSPLGAGLLVALYLGHAQDSRGFAKAFEIEHALVLREAVDLSDRPELLRIEARDERSQRLRLRLGAEAQAKLADLSARLARR